MVTSKSNNGNLYKWASLILTLLLLSIGWAWKTSKDADAVAYRVAVNEQTDVEEHKELMKAAILSREDNIQIKLDISYIKQAVDEIKKEVKNKP